MLINVLRIALAVALATSGFAQTAETKPTISITHVPRGGSGPDATDRIAGDVKGADPSTQHILIYSFAAGVYWVQPTTENTETPLLMKSKEESSFDTEIHLGSHYAILLVRNGMRAPERTAKLPEGKEVITKVLVKARPQ